MSTESRKRDRLRWALGLSRKGSPAPLASKPTPAPSLSPPIAPLGPSLTPASTSDKESSPAVSALTSAQPIVLPASPKQSASSPACRDLWDEARQRLSGEDRAIILKYMPLVPDDSDSLPETLFKAAKTKQRICEDKQWNFQFRGHTISLRDTANKVITLLEKFKAVGDVAANADPIHAGLPWAGIRFLLQVAVSESQQMGVLLLGLDRILYIINRCKVYEMLYPPDPRLSETGQNLESALINLYLLILQFLSKAIRLYERSTALRTLKAIWNPDDIIDFEERCQDHENRVEIEAQNCERFYSKNMREKSAQEAESLKHLLQELKELRDLKDAIGCVDTKVDDLWRALNGAQMHEILMWTSNIPYEDHHTTACKGRTEDTGGWLFAHRHYKAWRASDKSMILWLHGIPGAGKTKLVSRVIDHVSKEKDFCDQVLAYFYCNRNENTRRDPENILRSFVKQLSLSPSMGTIHNALVEIYNKKKEAGFASEKLTLEDSQKLLVKLIQAYSQPILVLDALDESCERTRVDLIKFFNDLVTKSRHLKIFISSRRDDDIKYQLEKKANVGIEAIDNGDDISKFVAERINQGQKHRRKPISIDLQNVIIQTLLEKSQGMFQWASLQIDQVLSLTLESEIRERLGQLPKDLKAVYDEIYQQIKETGGAKFKVAVQAFQWVMCACQPLQAEVLAAAVCQDPEDEKTQPVERDIDIDFILDACRNLLILDIEGIVRFSHLSVQEYFELHLWNSSQVNGTVAKVCLSLLNDSDNWDRVSDDNELSGLKRSGSLTNLLVYARVFWPIHVRNYGETDIDNLLSTRLEKFLGSMNESGPAYRSCFEMRQLQYDVVRSYQVLQLSESELYPHSLSSLAICLFGFGNILAKWWKAGTINIKQQNAARNSILTLAVLGGSSNVVKILIELGANVNMQLSDNTYGSALAAAAYGGNKDIVQLLLESGADINMQLIGGKLGSALAVAAAMAEDKDLVQLLLESGADINMQLIVGIHGSALAAAVYRGNKDIVQLLLESGADVNMQLTGGLFGSALAAAAAKHKDLVQLLLQSGADINMQLTGGIFGSALAAAAAASKHKDIVQLLLQSGADINMQLTGGIFGSALAAAVVAAVLAQNKESDDDDDGETSYTSVVKLLLKSGADVNMQLSSGQYGSALVAASAPAIAALAVPFEIREEVAKAKGNKHIVQLLLHAGADVNMQLRSGRYFSALAAAEGQEGNEQVVQLLLSYEAC